MEYKTQAFELAKIFSEVRNAETRASVLMREPGVTGQAKHWIKTSIVNRLTAILKDINYLFRNSPEDLEIVKRDMLDEEVTLQIDNCITLMLALPKPIRDEVEMYIEQRHSVYAKKVA